MKDAGGFGTINTYYGGLYGTYYADFGLYADASFIGGASRYRSSRYIRFPGVARTAKGRHWGNELSLQVELGYTLEWEDMIFQPFVNAIVFTGREQAYTEFGADSIDLTVQRLPAHLWSIEAGVQWSGSWRSEAGTIIQPLFKLSYIHQETFSMSNTLTSGFVGQTQLFEVTLDNRPRNQFAPAGSFTVLYPNGLYLNFTYAGQFFGPSLTQNGLTRFGYVF